MSTEYWFAYYWSLIQEWFSDLIDKFADLSFIIMVCTVGIILSIVLTVFMIIRLLNKFRQRAKAHKIIQKLNDRFYETLKTILTTRERIGYDDMADMLGLRRSEKINDMELFWLTLLLRDTLFEVCDDFANMDNLHTVLTLFNLDDYFFRVLRDGTLEQKIRITRALRYFDIHVRNEEAMAKMVRSKYFFVRKTAIFTRSWNDPNDALTFFNSDEFAQEYSRFDIMIFHDIIKRCVSTTSDLSDIMNRLNAHNSPRLRSMYIREIRYLNLVECCPMLVGLFENSANPDVNVQIVRTWGRLNWKEAEPVLMKSFSFQANKVKVATLRAIGTFLTGDAHDFLITSYLESYDYDVMIEAVKTLFKYKQAGLLHVDFLSISKEEDKELFNYFEEVF